MTSLGLSQIKKHKIVYSLTADAVVLYNCVRLGSSDATREPSFAILNSLTYLLSTEYEIQAIYRVPRHFIHCLHDLDKV